MTGIYKIKNLINNNLYIGQAINIEERWKDHKWELNNNKKCNKYLQNAWNKYGKDNFEFSIIEECEEDKLNEKEIYYISYYDSYNNGYNLTKGGDGSRGLKWSKEQRINHSKIFTGENHPMYGKTFSEEWKNNLSKSHLGQTAWNKGLIGYGKGKITKEETKQKMSISSSGENHYRFIKFSEEDKQKIKVLRNNNVSLLKISKEFDCGTSPIVRVLKELGMK